MTRSLIAGVLLAAALQAAQPNFSGDWKMNVARSEFGGMPAPDVLTRTIKHNDPLLEYKTYQKGAQGEVTTEVRYTTDGKPCINKLQESEARGTARWQGDALLIESARDFRGIQITSKETWTLADGGKTLIISSHVSVPQQGEFELKLVLDKQ
jgi:hypothetical protein